MTSICLGALDLRFSAQYLLNLARVVNLESLLQEAIYALLKFAAKLWLDIRDRSKAISAEFENLVSRRFYSSITVTIILLAFQAVNSFFLTNLKGHVRGVFKPLIEILIDA